MNNPAEVPALRGPAGVIIGFTVPFQRIGDIVCTALETPIGSWLIRALTVKEGIELKGMEKKAPFYCQGAYWSQPKAALFCTVDKPTDDHSGQKTLTIPDFQRAIVLLATKDNGAYAHHLGDFLKEQDDALTADVFMQMAIFGEEVFS